MKEEVACKHYVQTLQSVYDAQFMSGYAADEQVLYASDSPDAKKMLARIKAIPVK
jgi:hypothetical protein